ncbi:MAG: class I SAM-dependent methyltransferase [bacterium]
MKDLFGSAMLDYQYGLNTEDLITATSISEEDILPISYLFRSYDEMPILEQKALDLCKGKVLDVGCGAGSHSLYLEQKGLRVKSIDISPKAIEVCKQRGLTNVECLDIINEEEKFDTIILLMNGSGVFRSLSQTPYFLNHLKNLLNESGQILIDSSDISYMYEDHLDVNELSHYYGELDYYISYKGASEIFPWMYLDYDNLSEKAKEVGLKCELVLQGEHYDFLAKLTVA